jgi:hypothetical protein
VGEQWPLCEGGFVGEKYYLTIKHRCVYQCQVDRVEFAVDVLPEVQNHSRARLLCSLHHIDIPAVQQNILAWSG